MAEVLDVTSMLPKAFEPKRKNRWVFGIEGIDAYICKSAARPTFSTESIEIPWMNSTRYVAGKTKIGTFSVTLHDPIAPSAAQQVMEWLRLHTELVSGRSGYSDFYMRDGQLKLYDPIGTCIEYWDVKGMFLPEVNFGELSYDSAELIEVGVTIQCQNAALQF